MDYERLTLDELAAAEDGDVGATEDLRKAWAAFADVQATANRRLTEMWAPIADAANRRAREALASFSDIVDRIMGREVGADRLTDTSEWRTVKAELERARGNPALDVIRDVRARWDKPHRGRPVGSGTYRDRNEFMSIIRAATKKVRGYPSQDKVADILDANPRQLRRWVKRFGFKDWQDLLNCL